MPETTLVFFQESDGNSPALKWLQELRKTNHKAYAKCAVRIKRLSEMGHELRRPEADYLRDGIHELRARLGSVNYRILYFFHGRTSVILSQGFTKESEIPPAEIEKAISRKSKYFTNPESHTYNDETTP